MNEKAALKGCVLEMFVIRTANRAVNEKAALQGGFFIHDDPGGNRTHDLLLRRRKKPLSQVIMVQAITS